MNTNPKYKNIVRVILITVIVCLILTGIIINKMIKETNSRMEENWFFAESVRTGLPVMLSDAFIISNDDGVLKFIYDYKTYEVEGNLEETYFGVANILVEGMDITKVSIKPDSMEDVLVSYTENTIALENVGEIARNLNTPVYKVIDNQVSQVEWNEFIVGVSNIRCIMEEGTVAAILIEKEVVPNDVRVLIKNGDGIFYPELYVKRISDGVTTNVAETMTANGSSVMEFTDVQGLVLCDNNGQEKESPYEGSFRVVATEDGLVLVNEVSLETYLKYVLPSEMQVGFGHEALKAQAVCARTYAYSQMKNQSYAKYGANMDDSTAFQVYHNNSRYSETDAAVEETSGEVISCNGELVTCYYYSTSPGVTNDMSSWENSNPAYIGVQGSEQLNGLDLTNPVDFSTYMRDETDCFDKQSPMYRWKAILDISEEKDSEYGLLESIEVKERNEAGYITCLELVYENETLTLKNENAIRNALGKYLKETVLNDESVRTNFTMIPSACFEVIEQSDNKIVLRGGGFGHGIGMSQYGAKGMAETGYNYKEIVEYYYNNVIIKKM